MYWHVDLGYFNGAFTLNNIQYPNGWLAAMTEEERNSMGIYTVEVEDRPDDRFYNVTRIEDGPLIYYDKTEKDLELVKTNIIAAYKRQAFDELAPTDWYFTRLLERQIQVPQDVLDYRLAYINNMDQKIEAVQNCTTIADLINIVGG